MRSNDTRWRGRHRIQMLEIVWLGDSEEVGDHHLGYVLSEDQQAGHYVCPEGESVSGDVKASALGALVDAARDLVTCFFERAVVD